MNTLATAKAHGQKIVFEFSDGANEKGFTNVTDWNFEVKTHESNAQSPRWVKVVLTGPDVPAHITAGGYVLVEPLMWTHGFKVDGVKYWATDYAKVIGALNEAPTGTF